MVAYSKELQEVTVNAEAVGVLKIPSVAQAHCDGLVAELHHQGVWTQGQASSGVSANLAGRNVCRAQIDPDGVREEARHHRTAFGQIQ